MDNIRLRTMTELEFDVYFSEFRNRITQDGMKAFRVTETTAKRIVEKDLNEIIRDGFNTKNNYWFTILENERSVGSLWFSTRGEGEKKTPYLADVFVDPNFRRRNIAKTALDLLEAELKTRDIKNNIAVHILGDFNEAAIRLFHSKGYFVASILMEKTQR